MRVNGSIFFIVDWKMLDFGTANSSSVSSSSYKLHGGLTVVSGFGVMENFHGTRYSQCRHFVNTPSDGVTIS